MLEYWSIDALGFFGSSITPDQQYSNTLSRLLEQPCRLLQMFLHEYLFANYNTITFRFLGLERKGSIRRQA